VSAECGVGAYIVTAAGVYGCQLVENVTGRKPALSWYLHNAASKMAGALSAVVQPNEMRTYRARSVAALEEVPVLEASLHLRCCLLAAEARTEDIEPTAQVSSTLNTPSPLNPDAMAGGKHALSLFLLQCDAEHVLRPCSLRKSRPRRMEPTRPRRREPIGLKLPLYPGLYQHRRRRRLLRDFAAQCHLCGMVL
jgi:hypothetical protein